MNTFKAEIAEKVANQADPFAIFDFDNTCIVNDIGEATLTYLCRHKLLKDTALLKDYTGDYHEAVFKRYYEIYSGGQVKDAYIFCAQMFSGFTAEEAQHATKEAIREEGGEIGKATLYGVEIARGHALRPQVMELMEFIRALGVHIWVVSASHELAVRAAMEHFGISADLIGLRTIVHEGRNTSEMEMPVSVVEGKVECMRKYIHPSSNPLVVVDDSTTGLPILETAAIKVVVNRNNPLTAEAKKRGWHLI